MAEEREAGNTFENLPDWLLQKWQEIADLLADLLGVRAALIMKAENETMQVFLASKAATNPYHVGDSEKWYGLYCETVIKTQKHLAIPDATQDPAWAHNPDIKLGMIAYLGFPINFPNQQPFGTLCVLDDKERHFSAQQERLLLQFKQVIELDLVLHQTFELKTNQLAQALQEQVKKTRCVYVASALLAEMDGTIDAALQALVGLLPSGCQHPSATGVKISCEGREFCSPNFTTSPWQQSTGIQVDGALIGSITLSHQADQEAVDAAYLQEEHGMLREIARLIGAMVARKHAQETLQQSEEKYRRLIDTAYEGIWIINADSNTTFVNQRMAEMLGYTMAEMNNQPLFAFMDEEGKTIAAENLERRRQGIKEQHDFKFRRKDGESLWVTIQTNPIIDRDGAYQGALGMISDITERKRAEDQVRTALAEKEMLLRELNHRTKNNLNIVASLIHLQAETSDNKQFRALAETLENRIRSIAQVHQMLFRAPDLSQVNLEEYACRLVENLVTGLMVSRANIDIELDTMPVYVGLNTAIPCGQIINELLSNAFKYAFPAGRKGRVTIQIHQAPDGEITIRVADDGVGFPPGYDETKATSLGITLIHLLASQLHGSLYFDTRQGVTCALRFKKDH